MSGPGPRPYQIGAHVRLQLDLLWERQLLVGQEPPEAAVGLLVAPPLQPVGQEGLHDLVEDLGGDEQRGQALEHTRRKVRTGHISGHSFTTQDAKHMR